jgi:hypothetical protein
VVRTVKRRIVSSTTTEGRKEGKERTAAADPERLPFQRRVLALMTSSVEGVGVDESDDAAQIPLLLKLLENPVDRFLLVPTSFLALVDQMVPESSRLGFEVLVFPVDERRVSWG